MKSVKIKQPINSRVYIKVYVSKENREYLILSKRNILKSYYINGEKVTKKQVEKIFKNGVILTIY